VLRTEHKDEKRCITTRFARGTESTEGAFSPLAGDAAKGKDLSPSGKAAAGELILPCSHLPARQKDKVFSVLSVPLASAVSGW